MLCEGINTLKITNNFLQTHYTDIVAIATIIKFYKHLSLYEALGVYSIAKDVENILTLKTSIEKNNISFVNV